MKRANDANSAGLNKRQRLGPDEMELRLIIPSKIAGSIIGKQGSNIARLRTEYTAKVQVPDCPGPERVLSIIATEENAVKVVEQILPTLENTKKRPVVPGADVTPEEECGNEVDLRVLVHQSQAGCVIGKGGSRIKEMREKTGARIKIFSSCAPESTERAVQIVGQSNKVVQCLSEILELIRKEAPVRGPEYFYNPENYDDYYSEDYGGYGAGAGGNPSYGAPKRPIGRPSSRFGGPPRGPGGSGGIGGPRGAGPGFRGPGSFDGGKEDYDMGRSGAAARNGSAGGGGGERSSAQVTIPKDLAGAIIGKGGSKIRQVRMESGAEITIAEPVAGSNDRIITITGVPDQIQMAQYLLQQNVSANMKPPSGRF